MNNKEKIIKAKSALLPSGWSKNVCVEINDLGYINKVSDNDIIKKTHNITNVDLLLPSVSNLHSHSFQRAMAGHTETRGNNQKDSFWTWRDLMYKFLKYLSPEDIFSITSLGQMEMLKSGYSSVAEFHYLHHQYNGDEYDNIAEISQAIIEASKTSGIGLTLLPVLYEQGGCDGRPLEGGQKRFGNSIDQFEKLFETIQKELTSIQDFNIGIAAHSLRAVKLESLKYAKNLSKSPFHIHVAEQEKEVDEILSFYGERPVQWLLNNMELDENWCLIHCTQMSKKETLDLASCGAVIGLCPITEANLGDGIFNGEHYFHSEGKFGVGTDSNINIDLREEIKMLEYSQRLALKQRVIYASNKKSNGRMLFDSILNGGSKASGRNSGKIEKGFCADLMSLDMKNIDLYGSEGDTCLDKWIFCSQEKLISNLWSVGRHVVIDGRHIFEEKIKEQYKKTILNLKNKINF